MRTLIAIIAAACAVPAFAEPDPAVVLANVQKAYSHLTAIHVVATRVDATLTSDVTSSLHGAAGSSESEYELAEKPPGRFRARLRGAPLRRSVEMTREGGGPVEAIVVSDGSTTWKALPTFKQWIKLDAAAAADEPEDPEDSEPKDLHDRVARTLLTRIQVLVKQAERPEILKEDTLDIEGRKAPCYVLRLYIGSTRHDLWIDKERYLILREVQSGRQESHGGKVNVSIDTRVKKMEVDTDVPDTLFSFQPERNWTQVDTLVLPGEERLTLIGRPAADFTLKSLDGEPRPLSSLRGRVVVLDFWGTWCRPCRDELPSIEKLHAEFAGRVEFLAVTAEDGGTVRGFLKQKGYTFSALLDGKRQVQRRYGILEKPTVLLIDRHGVIRQHFVGSRTEQALRSAIQSVLEEEP